jgi:hypothetical protein
MSKYNRAVLPAVRGKISQLLDTSAMAPIKILEVKNSVVESGGVALLTSDWLLKSIALASLNHP